MNHNYNQFFSSMYKIILKKNKESSQIIKHLLKLKLPIDNQECSKINTILKKATENEVEYFFQVMKNLEKKTYKNYQNIDYFYLNNIPLEYNKALSYLLNIEKNFKEECEKIEKNNNEKILIVKEIITKNNFPIYLEGGLSLYCYKVNLRENKDIDFVYFDSNLPNQIQYDYHHKNNTITVDMFKNSFFLFQDPKPKIDNVVTSKNNIKHFNTEFIHNRIKNTILPLKRSIIIDFDTTLKILNKENNYYKKLKKVQKEADKITKIDNFTISPFIINFNELLKFYLVDKKTNYKNLHKIENIHSSIYLLIYYFIKDNKKSTTIYNFFIQKAKKIDKRFEKINFVYITLLIILPYLQVIIKNNPNIKLSDYLKKFLVNYLEKKMIFINDLRFN